MHIALAGPIAGDDIRPLLHDAAGAVPRGYVGAPLTAILIGELLRLGHRVTGITTDPTLPMTAGPVRCEGPGFAYVACPARPSAWRFNGRRPGRMLDFFADERRLLVQVMKDSAPDIVHAHWSYEFALAALDQPAPHLITCHDAPGAVLKYTRSPYRAMRYLMARRVFARGLEFSAVSSYMARSLVPMLGKLPQVVPNPVANIVLELGRVRAGGPSRRVAMVCNGWDRIKNAEPALRAFALWRTREPAAELHLFGSAFDGGGLAERWANQHGVADGLKFHGAMPHRALVTALSSADALLHPSLEESFGVVVAEAMALGLPVIGGRHSGAVPWVLGADEAGQSEAGLLVDVRVVEDIAAALHQLFDASYETRSAAGVARATREFSPQGVARAYETRYRSILQTGQAQGRQARTWSARGALR